MCSNAYPPLMDSKEIKPLNPKWNQPWIFIGRPDAEAEAPILCLPDAKSRCKDPTYWERLWCWERLRKGGEEGDRGWDCWMASPTEWYEFGQTLGDSEGQGNLACCSPLSCKELDTTEWLNSNRKGGRERRTEERNSCVCGIYMLLGVFRWQMKYIAHSIVINTFWKGKSWTEKEDRMY